jgi:hypothetical protein
MGNGFEASGHQKAPSAIGREHLWVADYQADYPVPYPQAAHDQGEGDIESNGAVRQSEQKDEKGIGAWLCWWQISSQVKVD